MTTKTTVEVLVDPAAEAKAKAIEAETQAAVERTWCREHPRVDPMIVHAVKGDDGYLITIDEVAYLCVVINPREVAIARVRPEDHQLLEAPHPVSIPLIPPPPPPPPPLAIALEYRKRCSEALDPFRRQVNLWRTHVDPRRADPQADLRIQYPGTVPSPFPGERDRVNRDGLLVLARIIEEVSHCARTVPAAARAHRQLVQDTTAAIKEARASLVVPVLPSILSAGEPSVQVARSDEERALNAAEGMVDKLRDALAVLTPTIQALVAASPAFLRSALLTLREGWCAIVRLRIAIEVETLHPLRAFEAERQATRAVEGLAQHLGQDLTVAEIAWPANPWEPPTLR
jgi:hypothetical protein